MSFNTPPWVSPFVPPVGADYSPPPLGGGSNPPHPFPTGGGGMPGSLNYTPDYMSLIMSDPAYAALAEQISGRDVSNSAQRQAATEQALIQFGAVPDFSSLATSLGLSPQAIQMLQHDIDPNAAALAQANTRSGLSTEAQLQQGQQHAIMGLRNNLAARGALSSGDDAYRTNIQNQAYTQAQQAALNSLLSAIGGYQNQYLSAHNADQDTLNQGLKDAVAFESGLPQNQGFHLTYNAKGGYYTDASGGKYTPSKNPDGTWTLTNTSTGYTYTVGADGTVKIGGPPPTAPPPPGTPPPGGWGPTTPPPWGPGPHPEPPPPGGWPPSGGGSNGWPAPPPAPHPEPPPPGGWPPLPSPAPYSPPPLGGISNPWHPFGGPHPHMASMMHPLPGPAGGGTLAQQPASYPANLPTPAL